MGSRVLSPQSSVLSPDFPYAVVTISEELTWKPALYRKGRWIFEKPRSGIERFKFPAPVGPQQIFSTIHSETATLPLSFPSLREASFKIGFPDEIIRAALSPSIVHRPLSIDGSTKVASSDCEITLALVRGNSGGKRVQRQAYCKVMSSEGHSAGDWDTVWPPAIVSRMIGRGEIQQRGVFAPERIVPLNAFFERLRAIGFSFVRH